MPTYPYQQSTTQNTSHNTVYYGPQEVHSINTNHLIEDGWQRNEVEKKILVTEYTKGNRKIVYQHFKFWQDGREIQFMEDIK